MNAKECLNELAKAVKAEVWRRMESPDAVNLRSGDNLKGTNLWKSVDVAVVGEDEIVFSIADYYEFVVNGWRQSGNFPNTMGAFLKNMTAWVRKKGIRFAGKTENQVVWCLIKSIFRKGIAPRPFIGSGFKNGEDPSKVLPFLDEFFSKWADEIFEELNKELEKNI